MKICMMTNTYLPHVGGVARSVHTFAEDYRRLGHLTTIVAPTFPGVEEVDPSIEKNVVRVPAVQRFNGSDFSVRLPFIGLLNPELLQLESDIVHSHHPFLLGDTAVRFAADRQVPVVFTHHTLYEEYLHYVPFKGEPMRQFVIELSTHYANLSDGVIAPSGSIADLIRKRGVKKPISVIPTGIDLVKFAGGDGKRFRRSEEIGPEQFVIGTLGRLAEEKNLYYLCGAVAEVLAEAPEAVFLAVGAGPLEAAMKRFFSDRGLSDRVRFPGKKTGQDLWDSYKAMDLFAFSSFSETQGLVLAEAMAAGLPVVALDASGVREVVKDSENGFMLSSEAEEKEFAKSILDLLGNPELRRRFREGAVKTAKEFSREESADKAISLYEEIVHDSRRKKTDFFEDTWSGLLKRIRIEWELLADKAESAFGAFIGEEEETSEERRELPNDRL